MSTPTPSPASYEELLRIIKARDSEVALLKLMVDKLKLQLLRRVRAEFGTCSEQWAAQIPLIDGDQAALMARSNSPTLGHPKFPQAGPPDYDDSGATAMRAAASLRR